MISRLAQKEIWSALIALFLLSEAGFAKNSVTVWALPAGEIESPDYKVEAGGKSAFVSTTQVLRGLPASFSSFDFSGTVQIKVTCTDEVKSFKILPANLAIAASRTGKQIIFNLSQPANLTIELNGSTDQALHLFAGAQETNLPNPNDPNVLYFGPGVHEIAKLNPETGQTIYLAPGAILRPVIPPEEDPVEIVDRDGEEEKIYSPLIEVGGAKNITIRGRGIIDMSGLPWHARKAAWFDGCSNILIEGITLIDAPDWAFVMHQCTNFTVRNIKEISWRENGDGIDICNSQAVIVENCFIRNNDDSICVKTISLPPALKSLNITVRNCVIWNERARALGITSETLADISAVAFQNCDIIHDFSEGGDCAALAVLVSDSGTVSNISFTNIRIEESRTKLIRCWVGDDGWSQDDRRGKIKGVVFQNIYVTGTLPLSEMLGYSSGHGVENVTLAMAINGQKIRKISDANLQTNKFAKSISIVGFN